MESSDFDLKERDNSLGVSLSSEQSASGTDSLRTSMNNRCAKRFFVSGAPSNGYLNPRALQQTVVDSL